VKRDSGAFSGPSRPMNRAGTAEFNNDLEGEGVKREGLTAPAVELATARRPARRWLMLRWTREGMMEMMEVVGLLTHLLYWSHSVSDDTTFLARMRHQVVKLGVGLRHSHTMAQSSPFVRNRLPAGIMS